VADRPGGRPPARKPAPVQRQALEREGPLQQPRPRRARRRPAPGAGPAGRRPPPGGRRRPARPRPRAAAARRPAPPPARPARAAPPGGAPRPGRAPRRAAPRPRPPAATRSRPGGGSTMRIDDQQESPWWMPAPSIESPLDAQEEGAAGVADQLLVEVDAPST